jgi:hypothetical protein
MGWLRDPVRLRARGPAVIGVAIVLIAAGFAASGLAGHGPLAIQPRGHSVAAEAPDDLVVAEDDYTLMIDRDSGLATVMSPTGAEYSNFPLMALAGAREVPNGAHVDVSRQGSTITERVIAPKSGALLQTVSVALAPASFSVTFSVTPGPDYASPPLFFDDGRKGFDLSAVRAGFSPDTVTADTSRTPAVVTGGRRPLAPAPLDVELQTAAGWFGIGIVQLPDATTINMRPNGAVLVDYPLATLSTLPDTGAGGMAGTQLRFPSFVFTFGANRFAVLRAYHDALVTAGAAPAEPPTQASWWQEPIVDTWGAQEAAKVARGSTGFTAAWVQRFVTDVRQRYGMRRFTVVIDSRWQQAIGDPAPDNVRFGGYSGMRDLINSLHAQGLRVMLWWPLWGVGNSPTVVNARGRLPQSTAVDPTDSAFGPQMTATVARLLGSGPGELDADGLKLDWAYRIPQQFNNPALGLGDAALPRYLAAIHTAAHAIRPDALVEASAAAPQFERVTDAVRLYDGWSETAWDLRAAVVTAADPGVLIDGDGWQATLADAVVHAVSSTVYGVPALYFDGLWANGTAVPETLASAVGDVMSLAPLKGPGAAVLLPDGEWAYWSSGLERAETFGGETGLVVWSASSRSLSGTVIATRNGVFIVPLPRAGPLVLEAPNGRIVLSKRVAGTNVALRLQAGVAYRITLS